MQAHSLISSSLIQTGYIFCHIQKTVDRKIKCNVLSCCQTTSRSWQIGIDYSLLLPYYESLLANGNRWFSPVVILRVVVGKHERLLFPLATGDTPLHICILRIISVLLYTVVTLALNNLQTHTSAYIEG